MTRAPLAFVLWIVTGLAATTASVFAEELPPNFLNGHRFSPSVLIRDPFIGSEVNINFAGAKSTLPVTVQNTPRDLELAGYSPTIRGQFKITDRFSLLLNLGASATTGVNTESAIIYGATVNYNYGFGLKFELLREPKSMLTLVAEANHLNVLAVSPLVNVIQRVSAFTGTGSSTERDDRDFTRVIPDLRFAYAFTPTFGIQARAGLLWDFVQDNDNTTSATFGLQASSNLKPGLNVPLDLSLNYVHDEGISQESGTNFWTLALSETVTERYTFALEVGGAYTPSGDGTIFAFVSRYYY